MGTYKQFKTNDKFEQGGVILDLGDAGKFRLARAGGTNKKYQQRLEALMRPHRRALNAGTLSNDVAESVLLEVIVDSVVLGWEGVTGPDGKELPFTKDNAKKLFEDLPDLFATIRDAAGDSGIFKEDVEGDLGN